ncbi:MAG: tetratricopeptide repeat protein [Bacteroidales bacterium]|jgi:tetratricopeptide (TPR) repeat protein|nr:tetratricopeptide repeat protein [Bacteroidales bacterium]
MDIEEDILIQKYETLLYNKESIYFDAEEFGIIITYYMMEERYADALEALIHAELCHPENIELSLHKIRIMMNLDNFDRAFELLLMLEKKVDDILEIHVYKGHIYTLNDEIENAVKEFELAFEKNPGLDEEELQYIPDILIEQKYFNAALMFLHKFIDSDKADAETFFKAGQCYEQISNIQEAEKYYEKSLDEDPFNEKTWIILGAMHLNSNNFAKALEAFEFALSINNNAFIASFCKIVTLMQSNEYDKAIDCIMEALSKLPGDAQVMYTLGECYEKKQDLPEAEDCYTKAISQEIDFDLPYWGLSKILYAQGDIESAIQVIDKAIELEPDNENYLYFRGQCFISLCNNKNMLDTILQNLSSIKNSNAEKSDDSEFINKHKKAVFFYNIRSMEECCKYLLESILIDNKGLEMFFNLFPEAKDDAYIINYFGKHLK